MKKTFKKYFVPHEGNDHKPHLLRPKAILMLAGVALVVEAVFFVQTSTTPAARLFALILPDALTSQTNTERVDDGLGTLRTNLFLTAAAQAKANDMAAKGYFAHYDVNGKSPWDWISAAGYKFAAAGENLAVNFSDSADVTQAWMNSPGHRANILNGTFTEIGIATAEGTYEGHNTIFVVEMFGRPAAGAIAVATTPPPALATPLPTPAATPGPVNTTPGTTPLATPVPTPTAQPTVAPATTQRPVPTPTRAPIAAAPRPVPVAVTTAQDTFISVEGEEPAPTPPTTQAATPGGIRANFDTFRTSLIESLITSPKTTVRYIYILLALLVGVALFLKATHRTMRQHPNLILNGLLFVLLVSAIVTVNQYVTLKDATVYGATTFSQVAR